MPPDESQIWQKLANDLTGIVLPLGVALSAEKNPDVLLEKILVQAKSICNADAGLLFLRTDADQLLLTIRHSIPINGLPERTVGEAIKSPPLPLYNAAGAPNYGNVATSAALHQLSINIPDIYTAESFDFSGTKAFDKQYNYKTISILAIPLKNHIEEVIGVFELINAKDADQNKVVPFDEYHQLVAESLASLATVALNNQRLLLEREAMVAALQARMAELQTIYEIGQAISASVELEKTLAYILTSLQPAIPYDAAEICLRQTATGQMVRHLSTAAANLPSPSVDKDMTTVAPTDRVVYDSLPVIMAQLIEQGCALRLDNFSEPVTVPQRPWQALAPQAYIGVPLKAKDKIIGVIELVSRQAGDFTDNNLRVLESIAVQASVAIQNAQEIEVREQRLKQEIRELRIQIDESQRTSEVERIVSSDYFQNLSEKAQRIRERSKRNPK